MGKGLLSGVAWGALAGVVGLMGVSLVAPLPEDMAKVDADMPVAKGPEAESVAPVEMADELGEEAGDVADKGADRDESATDETPVADTPGEVADAKVPSGESVAAMEPMEAEAAKPEIAESEKPVEPPAPQVADPQEPEQPDAAEENTAALPPEVPAPVTEGLNAPEAPSLDAELPRIAGADAPEDIAATASPRPAPRPAREGDEAPEIATSPSAPISTPETVGAEEAVVATSEAEDAERVDGVMSQAVAAVSEAAETAKAQGAEAVDAVNGAGEQAVAQSAEALAVVKDAGEQAVSEVAEAVDAVTADASQRVTGTAPEAAEEVGESAAAEADPADANIVKTLEILDVPEAETVPEGEQMAVLQPEAQSALPGAGARPTPEVATPVEPEVSVQPKVQDAPEAATTPESQRPVAETPATPVRPAKPVDRTSRPPAQSGAPAPEQSAEAKPRAQDNGATLPGTRPLTERQPRTGLPKRLALQGSERPGQSGSFGKRVVPLTERNKATGRLPTIEASAEASEPGGSAQMGALVRNAVAFDNPQSMPLFSVILIDVGGLGLERDALTTFSFPVTFAIDPTAPDAAEAAQRYRDAGFEVLLLPAGLPSGATPQDLETTLQTYFDRFPSASGLLDTPTGGIQGNHALSGQLLDIAADTGHGMVFYDQGLSSAKREADKAGLPAALVYRELDAGQERAPVITRYLDRAAFEAGQTGEVVMVGHTYADTVAALFAWAASQKGSQMAMAPISAVLMK